MMLNSEEAFHLSVLHSLDYELSWPLLVRGLENIPASTDVWAVLKFIEVNH